MCLFCQMLQPCSCMHLDIKMDSSTTAFLICFSLFFVAFFGFLCCFLFYCCCCLLVVFAMSMSHQCKYNVSLSILYL